MWLSSILNSLSPTSPHARTRRRPSPRQRPAGRRLTLEALEDRCLLSSYNFKLIADTGPNSPYSGLEVGQAINNLGAVAFEANFKSGGEGIFTRNPDGSEGPIIAITSNLISSFTKSPYMNDSGTVSFGAELKDGSTAILKGSGQELTRIADTEPYSPFGSITGPAPRIHQSGTVYFVATLTSGTKGFFVGNGGLPSILYVTGGQFAAFPGSPASQVNGDTVAFRATLTGGPDGVFTGNGGPTKTIADTSPDSPFSSFLGSEINDEGTVGIIANLKAGGQAIAIAKDGALTTFADTSGPFSHFAEGRLSISNQEKAVFGADLAAGGYGIFDGPDPGADKIVATGDELFGSTVAGFPAVNALNPRALNNAGQVIFRANLADGRTVLVRADPIRTVTRDYLVDITSTLPHYDGLPAQLDVHEVAPVYYPGQQHGPTQAAILVSGRSVNAVTGFDLQYQDYSLQESMARAGIDTFAVNFLGWGLSTRFGLDDPKNASSSDQKTYLIPNPLDKTYANPDPFHFTNTSALVDQLDAVVNDVRERLAVDKVSLFAWSRGGLVVGPYTYLHPEKVKNVVFDAGSYNSIFPVDPPNPLPQPGAPLGVQDRALFEATWTNMVDNVDFPGEQDPAILDPLWQSVMARDPLGSTWGANGLNRFPSVDYWGWNPDQHQASGVTVPALVLTGLLDTSVLPAAEVQLYNDLASENKVLIKVDGGSHFMPWEGSTSPTWKGPHATLQDAAVQWITSETYQGSTTGTFEVHSDGSIVRVSLAPSEASPGLVGQPITWTATATNSGEAPVYQFDVGPTGGPLHVVRDFSSSNSFTWAPVQEGSYNVQVTVKAGFNATQTASAVVSYVVNSRVTGSEAVISPTANPLVALYSTPPGPEGTVHVEFSIAGTNPSWRSTNELPSVPGKSTNFFVAGMLPSTTYQMRYVRSDGTISAPMLFTTGAIPPSVVFPSFTVIQPPASGSDLDQDLLFDQFASSPSNAANPVATDLSGRIVWYYDVSQSGFTRTFPGQSLVPGGTVLLLGVDQYALLTGTLDVLREIDLAGDTVRETNIDAVNAQLTALGHNPIHSFTHDVQRLPNGETAVIGETERTIDINGTPTDYVGMSIVVLDENFQVTWAWDAFDYLDVNRGPILGEVLHPGDMDQVALSAPRLPAVDWLHINAVSWSPADGNLVLSVRHQDWVIKIDYENGAGDGHVVWKLGKNGDFNANFTDPNLWFSHQHNAHYIDDSTLILFDNGDTRRAGDPNADSRGQVWRLDEQTMTATLVFNADLGNYSDALGAAQRLSNGNFSFTSGRQGQAPNFFGQSVEVRPDGTKAYVLQVDRTLYRSFRVRTLYEGTGDSLSAGGGRGKSAGGSPGVSVAPPGSDLVGVNSDPVNGFGASIGTPGAAPDDVLVAVAMASIAPLKQLATPTTLSQYIRDVANERHTLDSISVPLLDMTEITDDSRGHTLTGAAGRGLFLGKHDLELTDWDALMETFVEQRSEPPLTA
jgi:pimeloyl-ACP methyl ester carboxylesterase